MDINGKSLANNLSITSITTFSININVNMLIPNIDGNISEL